MGGHRRMRSRNLSPAQNPSPALGSISEHGVHKPSPDLKNANGAATQRPVPPGLKQLKESNQFDSAVSNASYQTSQGSKSQLSSGNSTSNLTRSIAKNFGVFGTGNNKEKENETVASNWWLLNSRKGAEAIRSRMDGISTMPCKAATFLQPSWRQIKPRSSLLGQLSKSIVSLGSTGFGSGGGSKAKKESDKGNASFVPDDDDEGLFDDTASDQPVFGTFVINPRSLWKLIWDIMILSLNLLMFIWVPFRFCFEGSQLDSDRYLQTGWAVYDRPEYLYFEYAFDCIYFVNMIFEMNCAFFRQGYDGEYQLYTSHSSILINYFFGYFWVDLIGSVPWEIILHLVYEVKLGYGPVIALHTYVEGEDWWTEKQKNFFHKCVIGAKIVRIVLAKKSSRVFVLTRIGRMDRYVQAIREQIAVRNGAVRVISFMSFFIISIHFIACVTFQLGMMYKQFQTVPLIEGEEPDPNADPEAGNSWLTELSMVIYICEDQAGVQVCRSGRVPMTSPQMKLLSQYLVTLYWMTTTMTQVGYGDITPVTEYEIYALIVAMIVGAAIFSQIVGNATQMILEVKGHDAFVDQELDNISRFMMEARMPKTLRSRVLAYFRRTKRSTLRSLDVVLDGIPDALCAELQLHVWHKALYPPDPMKPDSVRLNPLLEGLSTHILAHLVQKFEVKELAPNEIVFRAGQHADRIIIILAGNLEVRDPMDKSLITTIKEGGWCGEQSLCKGKEGAPFEIRSHGWCTILSLSIKAMQTVMTGHDEDAHWMKVLSEERYSRFLAAYTMSVTIHEILTTSPRRAELTNEFLIRELAEVRDYETEAIKHVKMPALTFRQKRLAWRRKLKSIMRAKSTSIQRENSMETGNIFQKAPSISEMMSGGASSLKDVKEDENWHASTAAGRRAANPFIEARRREEEGGEKSQIEGNVEYPASTLWMLAEASGFNLERIIKVIELSKCLVASRNEDGEKETESWDISRDFVDSVDVIKEARTRQLAEFPKTQVWVQCIGASNLRDDRFGGLIDRASAHPYCRFALGGTSFETLVVDRTSNPLWEEEFLFTMDHPLDQADQADMRVFVMDFEDEHRSYLMAICDIPIYNLPIDEWVEDDFEITNRAGGKAGSLKLRIKYVPRAEQIRDPPLVVHDLLQKQQNESQTRMLDILHKVNSRLEVVHKEQISRKRFIREEVLQATKRVLTETATPSFERVGLEMQEPALTAKATSRLGSLRGKQRKFLRKQVKMLRAQLRGKDGILDEDGSDQEDQESAEKIAERERQEAVEKLKLLWTRYESKTTGRPFWFNKYTKETRITDPASMLAVNANALAAATGGGDAIPVGESRSGTMLLQDLPDGWLQRLSKSKSLVFFQNMYDGSTSWQVPRSKKHKQALLAELGGLVDSSMLNDPRRFFGSGVYRAIPIRAPSRMPRGHGSHGDVYAFFSEEGALQHGWVAESNRLERPGELKRSEIRYKPGDSRVVYRGEMKGNKRHGTGVMHFADGVVYQGQWEEDYPSGFGVELYPEGFVYKGEFKRDCRHGLGVLQCPGLAYYGAWQRGRRHGKGVERLVMRGVHVEAFTVFDMGEVKDRDRADYENAMEAREVRDAANKQEQRANLFAETARLVGVRVNNLMDALSQAKRREMLIAEGYEDPEDEEDDDDFSFPMGSLFN